MMGKRYILAGLLLILISMLLSCAGRQGSDPFHQSAVEAQPLLQREIGNPEILPAGDFVKYTAHLSQGPVIPGLFQQAVPQGMALIPASDTVVISNYMNDGRPSVLTLVSMSSGAQEGVLWLHEEHGSPYTEHVGGLAATETHLWIASDDDLFMVPLEKITNFMSEDQEEADLILPPPFRTEVVGAFATVLPGILLVGEFRSDDGRYSTPAHHHYRTPDGTQNYALLAGFRLDPESGGIPRENRNSNTGYPDFFISIPDKVQGAVFVEDLLILSRSYGRKNLSTLSVYTSPLLGKSSLDGVLPEGALGRTQDIFTLENGNTVPVFHLNDSNLRAHITAPPMTEGIVHYRGKIAVLFESASDKYRYSALLPRDRIDLLDLNLFR